MAKRQQKFHGVLAEPIKEPWTPPTFSEDGKLLLAPSAGQIEQLEKMLPLAEHYGAATDGKINFFQLALSMAIDLVPGFEIEIVNAPAHVRGKKPRGNPQTIDSKVRDLNLAAFAEVLRRNGHQDANADIARAFAAFKIDQEDKERGRCRNEHSRQREINGRARTLQNRLSDPKLNNPVTRYLIGRWCDLAEQGHSPEERLRIMTEEADAITLENQRNQSHG